MPTYEYQCDACKHRFELFQSMKDNPKKKCPKCGKNALQRLIGIGAAVIFKGSGFYQTDYRSEAYKKSADADNKSATDAAKPAETKSADAKPTDSKATDPKPAATKPATEKPAPAQKPPPRSKSKDRD